MWSTYTGENGEPDTIGSDGGIIVADDEHPLGARITLERASDDSAFSITCGIYQWMMHTCHFSTITEARKSYDAMKLALEAILEEIPLRSDPEAEAKIERVSEAMSRFVDVFP